VVKRGWHRRLNLEDKVKLLHELEGLGGKRSRKLAELGIPASTYYAWRRRYEREGADDLGSNRTPPRYIWNRLRDEERKRILEVARSHPELSCRLLAVNDN
jgi:transposase